MLLTGEVGKLGSGRAARGSDWASNSGIDAARSIFPGCSLHARWLASIGSDYLYRSACMFLSTEAPSCYDRTSNFPTKP